MVMNHIDGSRLSLASFEQNVWGDGLYLFLSNEAGVASSIAWAISHLRLSPSWAQARSRLARLG